MNMTDPKILETEALGVIENDPETCSFCGEVADEQIKCHFCGDEEKGCKKCMIEKGGEWWHGQDCIDLYIHRYQVRAERTGSAKDLKNLMESRREFGGYND